jgi:hypothetical protein
MEVLINLRSNKLLFKRDKPRLFNIADVFGVRSCIFLFEFDEPFVVHLLVRRVQNREPMAVELLLRLRHWEGWLAPYEDRFIRVPDVEEYRRRE